MRPRIPKQLGLFSPTLAHPLAVKLAETNRLLHLHPEWEAWVHADLTQGIATDRGRSGLPAYLVLRAILLKHLLNVSLRKLAGLIADSLALREFLGLQLGDKAPPRSTLQTNVSKVKAETFGRMLQSFARSDEAREFEPGGKVRVDATVVETNVHQPSDSSLLWDCVRVLTRLMKRARIEFPGVDFEDRSRQAKRLQSKIYWARRKVQRVEAYHALLGEAGRVAEQVSHVRRCLREWAVASEPEGARRDELDVQLEELAHTFSQVMDQTWRRVVEGETVPASEKVYSVFEPHTDMIKKSKTRPPEFGRKVTLTVGVHFALDAVIERGNPADVTLAVRQIERQADLYGAPPEQVVFDGGYTSADNLAAIQALGTERCAFSKGRGLTPAEMAGSRRTYARLKRFRAGVEGKISWFKRDFGLGRCTWKGEERFNAYVWSALLAANLSKLATLRLEKESLERRRKAA
jgi:transposase, IS5 family